LAKLLKGRDDAAIINKLVAFWVIRQNPEFKGKFAFSEKPVGKAGCGFMFTPKQNWGPFIETFNKELAAMKDRRPSGCHCSEVSVIRFGHIKTLPITGGHK
jgi:ABC-type amino acid transport substrate-binding protein